MITIKSHSNTLDRIREARSNLAYIAGIRTKNAFKIGRIEDATPFSTLTVIALLRSKGIAITQIEGLVPMIHLVTGNMTRTDRNKSLGMLDSSFSSMMKSQISVNTALMNNVGMSVFGFIISEVIDNIEQHATPKNVYVSSQYNPEAKSCELCMIDDGIGIYQSLRQRHPDVKDDLDAMMKVIKHGLSAKSEHGSVERGMGIKTIRSTLVNTQLNGEFFLMSGNAAFFQTVNYREYSMFDDFVWPGTVVMMKLSQPPNPFNMYDYVN